MAYLEVSGAKVWKGVGDACCSSCAHSGGSCHGSLGDTGSDSVLIMLLGGAAIVYLTLKLTKKAAEPAKW